MTLDASPRPSFSVSREELKNEASASALRRSSLEKFDNSQRTLKRPDGTDMLSRLDHSTEKLKRSSKLLNNGSGKIVVPSSVERKNSSRTEIKANESDYKLQPNVFMSDEKKSTFYKNQLLGSDEE